MLMLARSTVAFAAVAAAAVLPRQGPLASGPIVALPYSTFQGITKNGVESWLGMPYAHQPVGDLRLRRPVVPPPTVPGTTIVQATAYGPMCIQQSLMGGVVPIEVRDIYDAMTSSPPYTMSGFEDSEACLTINVHRPAGTAAYASLPVVIWVHGGAFINGGSASIVNAPGTTTYDHSALILRSVELGTPMIHVAMNYRLNAFGFLGGKEIKAAGVGNLGLHDQREGIRWVRSYITGFGGDPAKTTIWGESAGAVSVGLQMVSSTAVKEKNFRAVVANSGGIIALGSITQPSKQLIFDIFTDSVNCTHAVDVLACIRLVPLIPYRKAMNLQPGGFTAYGGTHFPYEPSFDGNFFLDTPQKLLLAGEYTKVPFLAGECDDEGTLFSFSQTNVSTDADFASYWRQVWLSEAPQDDIDAVVAAYPNIPSQGSPYGTGEMNELYDGFKRMAAFQGDVWFQAARRLLLTEVSKHHPTWSWLYKRNKNLPFMGSYYHPPPEELCSPLTPPHTRFHVTDLILGTGLPYPTSGGVDNAYKCVTLHLKS